MKFSKNCFAKIVLLGFVIIFSAKSLLQGMEKTSFINVDNNYLLKENLRHKLPSADEKDFHDYTAYKLSSESGVFTDLKEAYGKLRELYGENALGAKKFTQEHSRISFILLGLFGDFEKIVKTISPTLDQNLVEGTTESIGSNIYFFSVKDYRNNEKFYCLILGDLIDYDDLIQKGLSLTSTSEILWVLAKKILSKCCCCCCCSNKH